MLKFIKLNVIALCALVTFNIAAPARAAVPKSVPAPARAQSLQLAKPFTLSYNVASQTNHNDAAINSKALITLSYDGNNLLYKSEDVTTHIFHVVLYIHDDVHDETYVMDSNSRLGEIDPGFDFNRFIYCPLPGVGIPGAPLLYSGLPQATASEFIKQVAPNQASEPMYVEPTLYQTPGQVRDYGIFSYANHVAMVKTHAAHAGVASVVSVVSSGTPKVLWYDTFDSRGPSLGKLWEFFAHQNFDGIWLATNMRMRSFTMMPTSKNVCLQDARYTLTKALKQPLPSSAYDPRTYLLDHANITDFTGASPSSFIYYTAYGALDPQRRRGMNVPKALAVNAKSPINTGAIGFAFLVVIFIVWFQWRRLKKRI